jgi:hypothetical protein
LKKKAREFVDLAVVPISGCSRRKTEANLMQWLKRNKQKKTKQI